MRFTPMSEKEIKEINLIEPGVYSFQILDAKEKMSKKGNEMIELVIMVWDANGRERQIYDYLIDIPSFHYKLRHFAECVGILDKYDSGHFTNTDCIDKAGKLRLGIQKDKTGQYADKNIVQDYIVINETSLQPIEPTKEKANEFDDDLPF